MGQARKRCKVRTRCVGVLTEAQRKLVEENLGLVGVHLRTRVPTPSMPMRGREFDDLFQEGVFGLMRAAVRWDPKRHGVFAAFALPRIRGAVFAALHEQFSLIRLPPQVLQRESKARREAKPDLPGQLSSPCVEEAAVNPDLIRGVRPGCDSNCETIRHRMRDRYEQAVRSALIELRERRWRRRDPTPIMERLAMERMLIDAADDRTPLRQIAREVGVSSGRISAYEQQLTETVQDHLASDAALPLLLEWSIKDPDGVNGAIDQQRSEALRDAECETFVAGFERQDRTTQARMMLDLIERATSPGGVREVVRDLCRLSGHDGTPLKGQIAARCVLARSGEGEAA